MTIILQTYVGFTMKLSIHLYGIMVIEMYDNDIIILKSNDLYNIVHSQSIWMVKMTKS